MWPATRAWSARSCGDGGEVGSHTYTHANLATAGWREGVELTLTQNALAGAAGIRTRLLRMPYSSEPDALTAADWRAARQAGRDGYLVCSLTWTPGTGPGPESRTSWPPPAPTTAVARSSCSMTAAGTASETVAALPAIITRLRAEGYRFTTVTGGLRLVAGDVPATTEPAVRRYRACAHPADRRSRRRLAGSPSRSGECAHRYQAVPARRLRRGAPAPGAPSRARRPAAL